MVGDPKFAKSDRRQSHSDEQRGTFYYVHPVWHSRSPKQRVWMGPGRYLCCSGRRYTNADAYCYSDSDCHANGQRHRYCDSDRHGNRQPYCNSIGNCHAATDANAQVGAIRKAAPHASAEAIEFRRTGNSW
jgi:hypothetical protein